MIDTLGLKVLFVAGFGPISRDARTSNAFYREVLGVPMESMAGNEDYVHAKGLNGARYFAIWPLTQAAQSCFQRPDWPAEVPTPQAWLELDVEDVPVASTALKSRGYRLLVDARTEPWGQTVTRLLSPEGILLGLTFTPWMREEKKS